MDLDEYLWKTKKTSIKFSRDADCSHNTIGKIKLHQGTPNGIIALKIIELSGGQITLYDLLSEKDQEIYKKWMCEKRIS